MDKPLKQLTKKITRKMRRYKSISPDVKAEWNCDKVEAEVEKFKKAMKKIGFEFIDDGASRIVFATPDKKYVIKISLWIFYNEKADKTSNFDMQSEHEVKFSKKIPDSLIKHFVLPIAHAKDYSWVLMPKVKVKNHGLTSQVAYELESKLREIFTQHDLYTYDLHSENVGELNGCPVMIDYGMEERC